MTDVRLDQSVSPVLFLKLWREIDTAEREAITHEQARKVIFIRAALFFPRVADLQRLDWDGARCVPEGSEWTVFRAVLQQQAKYGRRGLVFYRGSPMPFPRALWRRISMRAGAPGLRITQCQIQWDTQRVGARRTLELALSDYVGRVGQIEFRQFRNP